MTGRAGDRHIGGIVLCGGKSARMGTEKIRLPFGDRTLLWCVVEVVAGAASPVVVVKAAGQELPDLFEGVEVAADRTPDRGPLEGFMVGLEHLGGRCEAVFAVGCDYPLLTVGFLSMLAERLDDEPTADTRMVGTGPMDSSVSHPCCARMGHRKHLGMGRAEVVVARVGGWLHPLAALYRVGVADRVEALLASGRRSMHRLLDHCTCRVIEEPELADVPGGLESLTNVNTAAEYEAARRRAERP